MPMQLRPYQQRALDDLWAWFLRHDDGNPIVEAVVGAGKSLMIAALAQRADKEHRGTRVLVLVHQKELLEQNVEKILAIWPDVDVGIYSASAGKKQLDRQITYATIGSIYRHAEKLGRIDIVLADECHLINPKQIGTWRRFLADLARYCPSARTIGWTGTPFRGDWTWLTAGDDPLFDGIAARITMKELLELGYLSPLVPAPTVARIDTSEVRMHGGDYVVQELAKVTDRKPLVEATCDEIVRLAESRKRWLVFCVTIEHALHVRDALRERGVRAEMVSAETPKQERALLIASFRAGNIRCLVNVAVLTTGFDVPEVDFIGLLRATRSPVLYVQIAGRGMRVAPGKTDCLWADFSDTTDFLGPVDAVKGRPPKTPKHGPAPSKLCPECGGRNPTASSNCMDCGYVFPEPQRIKHDSVASGSAILSSQQQSMFETVPVSDVKYRMHQKAGSPPSLRVDYWSGIHLVASEWVCLSHSGYARTKAETWWRNRSNGSVTPDSTEQALGWIVREQNILRRPVAVIVSRIGKYPTIVSHQWEKQSEPA
jgi:DNA repair protein RadD